MRRCLATCVLVAAGCATPTVRVAASNTMNGFVDGPVGRLHVVRAGQGDLPVVFVHGLGGDTDTWREALQHLQTTRQVVAFDARGHGQSVHSAPVSYTIDGWVDDLQAVVNSLGARRVLLVGHSISGCVLQRFTQRNPTSVAGLVYVDAIGTFQTLGDAETVEGYAKHEEQPTTLDERTRDFTELLGAKAKPETTKRVLASLSALDPAAWSGFRSGMMRFTPPPEATSVLTVAIDAEGNTSPVRYAALRPQVRVVTLPGVSHWVMLDDPKGFAQALDEFVDHVWLEHQNFNHLMKGAR